MKAECKQRVNQNGCTQQHSASKAPLAPGAALLSERVGAGDCESARELTLRSSVTE